MIGEGFRYNESYNFCPHVQARPTTGAQPRAARERFRDFALREARLVGCSALLGSPPVLRTARVVLRTPLRASFTASSVGKASATSGSIRFNGWPCLASCQSSTTEPRRVRSRAPSDPVGVRPPPPVTRQHQSLSADTTKHRVPAAAKTAGTLNQKRSASTT